MLNIILNFTIIQFLITFVPISNKIKSEDKCLVNVFHI